MKPSHHPRFYFIMAVLFALLAAGPLAARQLPGDELLDLDLKDADLVNTLRSLALIRDLTLDLGDHVSGTVTATLDNVPWSTIVETLCAQHALTCDVVDDAVLFVRASAPAHASREAEHISLSLRDAALFDVLRAFGRITGLDIQIAPTVQPTSITVNLDNVPWPRALEGVCQLGNCQVKVEGDVVQVEPVDGQQQALGLDFAGETTDLASLFAQFADMVLLGHTVRTDIDPRAQGKRVFLDLEHASWSKLLDVACQQAGCDWSLVFAGNAPLTLRVRFHDERLAAPLEMDAFEGRLEDATIHLAAAMGLLPRLDRALDPDLPVLLSEGYVDGRRAADALCAQADCGWHLDGRTLVVRPRVPLLTSGAPIGSRAPRIAATFTPPAGRATHQADARFSWAKPMHRVGALTPGAWQLHLTWIPFGEHGHVVVPLVVQCGAPVLDASLAALEPVSLPLDAPWRGRALGAEVVLAPASATAEAKTPAEPLTAKPAGLHCFPPATHHIQVTFPDLDRQALTIDARPGAYLLVTPPPAGPDDVPAPAAAVLALGATAKGAWSVGIVRPGQGPAIARLERLDLRADAAMTTTLDDAGNQPLSIRVVPAS